MPGRGSMPVRSPQPPRVSQKAGIAHPVHDIQRADWMLKNTLAPIAAEFPAQTEEAIALPAGASVPDYLNAHYWWAYIHPTAVKLFERQWLVNLILWGNYARLRDAVLAEMGESLPGTTLQVACVYGDLT